MIQVDVAWRMASLFNSRMTFSTLSISLVPSSGRTASTSIGCDSTSPSEFVRSIVILILHLPIIVHLPAYHIKSGGRCPVSVSYTHLRAHETRHDLVCRLLLAK